MRAMRKLMALTCLLVLVSAGCDEPELSDYTQPTDSTTPDTRLPDDGLLSQTGPGKFVHTASETSGFVGSNACRQCHGAICDEFSNHPMGKSVSTEPDVYAETTDHAEFKTTAGLTYTVTRTGDLIEHHEKLLNEQGEAVFERGADIRFAVGSGSRGRSYCFVAANRIYMSPVTWYSKRKTWDLSPGYQPENHPGFERKASDGCMACHAGRMDIEPGKRDQFKPGVFLEASIGCERCHGPGEQHVQYHSTKQGEDLIVNPIHLSPQKRDAVCFQCHLQGERRVVRYGHDDYDFQPGMNVNDVWVTFVKDGKVDGGGVEAVSQVEQMLSSRCYTASQGRLGCISCHDPHKVPKEEEYPEFYRAKCQTCHTTGQDALCSLAEDGTERVNAGNNCIACHMPSLAATDVPHTAQTDHRVLKIKSDTSAEKNSMEPEPFRMPVIFEEGGYQIPEHERIRAQFILIAENVDSAPDDSMARNALEMLGDIVPVAADDADLFEATGLIYERLRNTRMAEAHWKKALEIRGGDDEAILELLATMYHNKGDVQRARDYYAKLVAVNDSRPTYFGRFAHALGQSGQLEEGIAVAKKTVSLNPGLPQVHFWLAEAYLTLGNSAEARYHRMKAEELVRLRTKPSESQPKSP